VAAADPLQHHQPSNIIGKFRLMAELGRGGMSEVYLAVVAGPAGFNKLVVIKLIKGELAEDPDFISMFLEEARLSARLSHPNVVQTNEVGEFGGRYFIAMEYLEGQPYSRILHRLGRDRGLPLGMSLRILSDVLAGLQYAHDLADFDGSPLGVVHRDVTPHNVFVTYDGQVKVVDFGIAKAMNSAHETRTGMLKGKVGYMAPEQAKGERVDRRADIFSVGVMLWEAAVGRRLWKGLNEVQILHQLLSGEIPSPRSMRPDISHQLEAIIMKALSTDREQRHGSAAEMQAALDELMDAGSERSTLRETGRLLSNTFDEERKKLKAIIEQQVQKSASLATGIYNQVQLPQVEQQAYTGELQRVQLPAHSGPAVPQMGFPNSSSLPSYNNSGSRPAPMNQSYPGAQASHPGASYQARGGSPGSHPGGHSHPGHSQPGHSQPGHSQPGHSHLGHSHLGHSHPGHSQPAQPANGFQNITGSGVGPLPNLGQPMSGSEPGHSSQPSVSNSLAISHSPHLLSGQRQESNKKLTMVALGFAAAAGGLGALLYVGFGRSTPAASSAPDPSSTTVVAATATETSQASVPASASAQASASDEKKETTLDVKVTPEAADIFLDGKKVGTGTLKTSIPMDGLEHELKVDAQGYSAKVRKIQPNEAAVTWEPELIGDKRGTGAVRPPPPPPDPTSGLPKRDGNGKIVRPIDPTYNP